MKVALVNPPWSFDGSIYFGCREPHLPLEYGYAKALLERAGHEARIIDAQAHGLDLAAIRREVEEFGPDMTVVTTAPSYLFWRCAPPEMRVPMLTAAALRDVGGLLVGVGPHASTTPRAALRKLGADAVVLGECEEILVRLAETPRSQWHEVPSIAYRDRGMERLQGGPHASDLAALPALRWDDRTVARHAHHHHRFDAPPSGPGAEIEISRGCPYHCTFCAKENFRDKYRKRPLDVVMDELDGLVAQGVRYVYFIDEIFLPQRALLEAMVGRNLQFGIQTRLDLWKPEMLDLLGAAGCVSIEAGVESLTPEGRAALDKNCRMSTEELTERLLHAKRRVPFVQANLIKTPGDDPAMITAWRETLRRGGVWANDPVPLYPYPSSPDYRRLWGAPDDEAWERAHTHYLAQFSTLSDIQDDRVIPLPELEAACCR